MPCYCIVLNCQTPSRAKGRSYCRIPAIITNQGEETQRLSEERRRLWLAAINRGELTENTLQHARVCGAHFVSGKAAPLWNRTSVDWVPTLNLRLQTISVDEERAQERAWRQFTKRRRREAGHQMIGAHSIEEKHSSGAQAGGDTTAPSTSKRARVSDSLQHGGEDLHGAGDHVSEEDSTPMVGTLGFSKETTLALLNRMFTEELLSELNRRSIVVKPAGGDRPRGRSDLEHVLREVMTREYEEAEGNSGTSMDTSNTSSTFEHSRSDASSSFEHSSRLDEETSGSEVFSGPNNEQAPTDNIQEPTMMIQQTSTSRQAADMNISEAPSTSSAYPVEVLVKKEPVEDVEYCVATSSSSSNIVASTTEPSTSQTGHPGIGDGSQGRLARNLSQAERIKTESEVEEGTEDIEQEDLSSEHCPSSPRQLSQELDKVEVSTEDEGDAKPSTSTEEPVKGMNGARRRNKIKREHTFCDWPIAAIGATTTEGTTASKTTSYCTPTGSTTVNNTTGSPSNTHPPSTEPSPNIPPFLNTSPPLNTLPSPFNTNAMSASTACNGGVPFQLSHSHPTSPENTFNSPGHSAASQVPPGDNRSQAEVNWIYPNQVHVHVQARQPPVPLGGPEHGVLTYPYILTQAKNKAKTPEQFFKELMGIYFTEDELFRGNLHGGGNNEALNPAIIGAILAETKRQYGGVKVRLYRVVNEKCGRVRATCKSRKKRNSKLAALQDASKV
ncbi:serine-rich adhesin for platelets-like isoform X9 [Branchiostoma floridae]|uniref:Serine-rich adhesin for platelets-like isoform X9 n=1 Tax=Branchiostoma floridae TaxID=7739 RepID=A0A9J7L5W8_BRAFL|nr:serine-rich adhesin for platelets-like isoform X9 [Branchiostoma floridae]